MGLPISQEQFSILLCLSNDGLSSRASLWFGYRRITNDAKRKRFDGLLNHLVALRKVDRLRLSGGRIVYRINPSAV